MDITIAFGDRAISFPVNVLFALICLALFLRYRRQVLSDRSKWVKTRDPVQPSLVASKSAFDVMWDGSFGCFWSLVGALAMFFVALVGIDLILFDGVHFRDVLYVLFSG